MRRGISIHEMRGVSRGSPSTRLEDAERAHYRFQAALYMPHRLELPSALLVAADDIPDPEWNHAGVVRCRRGDLASLLARAGRFLRGHGLPLTVAVSPASRPRGLSRHLAAHGFGITFRHRWLFWSGGEPRDGGSRGLRIDTVETDRDMTDFLTVFRAGFATESPDQPLAPGYARALLDSRHRPRASFDVLHVLARLDGAPAGAGTVILGGQIAGLYNLAVLPSLRRRGIGRALTDHRVALARARGCSTVFLQTESSAVERWQRRHGFEHGFPMEGWSR